MKCPRQKRHQTQHRPNRTRPIRDSMKVTTLQIFAIGFFSSLVAVSGAALFMHLGWLHALKSASRFLTVFITIGTLAAQGYGLLFRSAHRSGAGVGATLGIIQWGLSLPFLLGSGVPGAIAYFVVHVIYGALVGSLFDRVAICDEYPAPIAVQ